MSLPVIMSDGAREDIARLVDYLAVRNRRAAIKSVDIIEQAIASLADFPNMGAPGPRSGYREIRARFDRGAYVIRYQVRLEGVLITSPFHSNERR